MGQGIEKKNTFLGCCLNHVNEYLLLYLKFKEDSLVLSFEFLENYGLQGT